MKCDHPEFEAMCEVNRLTSVEDGPVTGYSVDVRIKCAVCGEAFAPVGMPGGVSAREARCGLDGVARIPLEPMSVWIPPSSFEFEFPNRSRVEEA